MCSVTNYVEFVFTKKHYFLNFNHVNWSNILYMMWKPKFKKEYFILFSCVCWIEISLKVHNGHKKWKIGKNYLGTICLCYEYEEWCETNNHIQ